MLQQKVDSVTDSFKGVGSVVDQIGDALNFGPISGVMNLLGGD